MTSPLGGDLRNRARTMHAGSIAKFEDAKILTDVRTQIEVTVGLISGHMLFALGDIADLVYGEQEVPQDQKIGDLNHSVRMAAARGDWNEFSRIIANTVREEVARSGGGSPAGDGPELGSVEAPSTTGGAVDQPQPQD